MGDEQPAAAAGRRRSLRPHTSAHASALERLRALRSGESRSSAPQIKLEAPIYDTVDEDEYQALVSERQEQAKGFIVDDDQGLGYGDDGHEEDWSLPGGPCLSSSEEEDEKQPERKKAKKKEVVKKPSPLAAAAALMGKQRLSSMFTSSVYKSKSLASDGIVDDVIAEFAPDESDRERRRLSRVRNPIGSVKKENPSFKKESLVKTEEKDSNLGNGFSSRDEENPSFKKESLVGFDGEISNLGNGSSSCDEEMMLKISEESEPSKINVENAEIKHDLVEKVPEIVKIGVENGDLGVKESFVFNARVGEEKDPALSATAGWQAVRNAGNGADVAMNSVTSGDEKPDFVVDSDGSLPFYILDAHEEFYGANMGNLYLFGKVKAGSAYHSCCVVVKNMQRRVYAIPKGAVFKDDEIRNLEQDVKESRISATDFRTKLQEMASELKTEIAKQVLDRNVSSFSMAPVKRNYAFERSDIPTGENYTLKINYPFKDPPLSSDLKGETFSALLGTHSSALELFLVKRKIKGPSWLSVSRFSTCSAQRVSWCKFEVVVECPKDINISASTKTAAEIPPVVVTAINIKTIISEKHNTNEIVSASVVCCHKAKIDAPTLASEWTRPGMLSHFAVVRKLEGSIFPMGFSKEVNDRNSKAGQNVISIESSERALLNRLMIELHKLDSDVLLGHNISGFDLDVLLHRAQVCRVPSNMWSKIGRLKRSMMPKLSKSNAVFGSGASPGIMSCMAGRLLCDTFLCSRDLLREVSYSLTHLTKTQLNKDRKEIAPNDIRLMFQSSEKLLELIECCETDAWLSMELMFHLSILPLTRQLTNISGNLWGKTLQGARAQRVEYLLLHAFHSKKFMVPDKYSAPTKETKVSKRKVNDTAVEKDIDDADVDNTSFEDNALQGDHGKAKKGPAYLGGLVLEPKKGLYDKYILLLDFNSLYPSIIQEFNICFTTVERSHNGLTGFPTSKNTGVLPELLKNLVERRKMVKKWLKSASGLKAQQFDIQQQALKLTANSMYGCLGFSSSRFYAKPLAEMITLHGREILQSTVDLVQNKLNLDVIYGDTDSIMIYSGLDDIAKAKSIAGKVIQEVNQKYNCLEIDLDGLYKRMLLLKKKKYAAVKVQFKDGKPYEVIERKGLDMVRRDWSLLSKELGDFCLSQILSGGSCEDVVESIHSALMKVKEDARSGQVPLEKYVITKTLTKPPEAYPDGRNQPHVEVALRLKKSGYSSGCSAGDTVPYVICCEQGTSSGNNTGIAQRARHPEELKKDNGKWIVDIDYYLSQQIHPVVSRLCADIQGTSPARLADCLGLDSSKFQSKSSEAVNSDPSTLFLCGVDDDDRYAGCEPLVISCPSCSNTFDCPSVSSSVLSLINQDPADPKASEASQNFWCKLRCPKCPEEGDLGRISSAMISNLVKRQADGFISTYYKGLMTCDDETCKYTTRSLNLRVLGDSERGTICPNYPRCNGHLIKKYTEADLYKQLSYFCYVLDTIRCLDKVEQKIKLQVERELAKIRPVLELAASTAQKLRDRCAFGWVQLNDLFEI